MRLVSSTAQSMGSYDERYGFKMEVNLLIQIEAVRVD